MSFLHSRSVGRQFIQGSLQGGIHADYFSRQDADKKFRSLVGRAWFGAHCEGPPAHTHGGAQAAALDEAMGTVVFLNGKPVLAGELSVRFHNPLPLGTNCIIEANIEEQLKNKVLTSACLKNPDTGQLFSSAKGIFVDVSAKRMFSV
eukprot:m.54305 g.54305  ORF g.54305 m.54305 type:complete len:147 (-) comp18500_c0_seq3:149-589(-)